MKIGTTELILGGLILGGGYLAYKYFTPKKIAETITTKTIEYVKVLPSQYYKQQKVLSLPYSEENPQVASAETFVNIAGIITRVNPFTRTVSPIVDWVLMKTGKILGGK